MKRKNGSIFRRMTAAAVAAVMGLSLAACGGSSSGAGADSTSGSGSQKSGGAGGAASQTIAAAPQTTFRDGVVRAKAIDLSGEKIDLDGMQILALEDGWIYGYNYLYQDDGSSGYELVRFKEDGSGFTRNKFEGSETDMDLSAAAFGGGNYYIVKTTYANSPALNYELDSKNNAENADEDGFPVEMSEDAPSIHHLCSVSPDGKAAWDVEIKQPEDNSSYYIDSIAKVGDDVFVVSSMGVDRYSAKDGAFVETVCSVKAEEITGNFYALPDGTVLMCDDTGAAEKIMVYDSSSKKFVEKMSLPAAFVGSTIYTGTQHDLYLSTDTGIYAADLKDNTITTVVDFVNSDLDLQGVMRIIEAGEGRLAIQSYGSEYVLTTYILELVAPEDVKEKKELVLGGYYIDFDVRSQVIKFNKENDEYRITIKDYSQFDSEDDDYNTSGGKTRMNADIASGNAPDIMALNEEMPTDSYISKGVFEDLTARYEEDKEIDKSDFLKNITDAFLTDGKMYLIVPTFTVTGVSGKTKFIGDGKDLSIDKAKEIAEAHGIRPDRIFGVTERSTILSSAIEFSGNQFIDREAHTCSFNNPQFQKLLEFVKTIPTEVTEDMYQDIYTQYLGDKALLGIQYLNSMYDYYYMTRDMFGDLDVTVTGFPSEKNQGPSVAGMLKLGISSSTSYPDGCWAFIRQFLMPEFQMSVESPLPISEKAIRAQGEAIIKQAEERLEAYDEYLRELNGTEGDQSADSTVSEALAGAETGQTDESGNTEVTEDMVKNGVPDAETEQEEIVTSSKPVPREEFDGTDEEYEQYVKDLETSASSEEEEVLIGEDEAAVVTTADDSVLPEFSEKDIERFLDILKSLSFSVNAEQTVLNIIIEESAAYFEGQKTAAEVSDIIQSRVQVYLKENE